MYGIAPVSPLAPINKPQKVAEKNKEGKSRPKQNPKPTPHKQLDDQPLQHIDEIV